MKESDVKYLSGLLDADGCLSFMFSPPRPGVCAFYTSLMLTLASSDTVDKHGFVETLPVVTGVGAVYRHDAKHPQCKTWTVTKRADLEMLLPRLIKHMVVKGKHWQWLLDRRREQRGVVLTKEQCEQLAIAAKKSRVENVGPIKPKNHPTWAWLAGYLDGDGHYSYTTHNGNGTRLIYVGATAHENDASVLLFLQRAFGGSIYDHKGAARVKRWRRYLGKANQGFTLRFLPKLAQHSRLKRHSIEQILSLTRQQRLTVSAPAGDVIV